MPALDEYLTAHADEFEAELCNFLRIPSVSADPAHKSDIENAAKWVDAKFRQMGFSSQIIPTNGHPLIYAESPEVPGCRHRPGLWTLRRPAGRPAGIMDQSALRADPPRRESGRPRMETEAAPPAASAPLLFETFIQAAVGPSDQLKAVFPAFVNRNVCVETVNGPPAGPLATAPLPGVIWKPSGCVSAIIKLPPGGAAPARAKIIARHGKILAWRSRSCCCQP